MLRDPTKRHAIVVYESMFGNTEAVARAVGDGLATRFDVVDVVSVATAPTALDAFDVVVVGGPTHAFGLTRTNTRAAARDQGASGEADRGIREWLADVAAPTSPTVAVSFDTRIRKPLLLGSAARGIRRRLRRLGFDADAAISFTVTATPGPLDDGELDRARKFGATIALQEAARSPQP